MACRSLQRTNQFLHMCESTMQLYRRGRKADVTLLITMSCTRLSALKRDVRQSHEAYSRCNAASPSAGVAKRCPTQDALSSQAVVMCHHMQLAAVAQLDAFWQKLYQAYASESLELGELQCPGRLPLRPFEHRNAQGLQLLQHSQAQAQAAAVELKQLQHEVLDSPCGAKAVDTHDISAEHLHRWNTSAIMPLSVQ